METTDTRNSNMPVRSEMSWRKVFASAALGTLCIFLLLNVHGCWLFRNGPRGLVIFLCPFVWLVLFFAIRTKGRLVLLFATIPALILFANGRWGIVETNAGPESAAFKELRRLQSGINAAKARTQTQDYPDKLPSTEVSSYARKFYRFEYIPRRSVSGEVVGYLLQATPVRRDCEYDRSFAITEDGRVFWTLEPRPATASDTLHDKDSH